MKIFTLATLLTSYLIYNSKGTIDAASLDQLGLVADLARNIQVSASDETDETEPQELAKIFP